MSPRNRWIALCIVTILSLAAPAGGQSPPEPDRQTNRMIQFYQTYLSGADGDRCPMYPTCSEYAGQALKKHGPVIGWIMSCDRLIRCGRSETRLAPDARVHGQTRVFDPVEANDFWWFTPRSDPEAK